MQTDIISLELFDFVMQKSNTTGSSDYALNPVGLGFTAFSEVLGSGALFPYSATDGVWWEVGIGRFVADGGNGVIERDEVLASFTGPGTFTSTPPVSPVNWGAGEKTIRLVAPAALLKYIADAYEGSRHGTGRYQVTTSDATPVQLIGFYIAHESPTGAATAIMDVLVTAASQNGGHKAWHVRVVLAQDDAGSIVVLGTPVITMLAENAAGSALQIAIAVDGIECTGLPTEDVRWCAYGTVTSAYLPPL